MTAVQQSSTTPVTVHGMNFAVSVIISNYNYVEYVGAAIQSALELDWPDVEVIVVDDGSTDASREVIAGFGARVSLIAQENRGQLAACNRGFARARGDIVIFLDSDDMLAPSLVRELAAVWTPAVSKVQVQMRVVDAAGNPTGTYFPQYEVVPSPRQVRRWATSSTGYPTPPGSGNAYARSFLERIFPLPETCAHTGSGEEHRAMRCRVCSAADSYCLATAPLLGEVHTIARPLVSYRVHGRNDGALSRMDAQAFSREMMRAHGRHAYARQVAASAGIAIREGAINRSLSYLSYRLASIKLSRSTHPLAGDGTVYAFAHFFRAFLTPQGFSLKARLLIVAWACAVALSPRRYAAKFVLWRFAPAMRPRPLHRLLTRLGAVRA